MKKQTMMGAVAALLVLGLLLAAGTRPLYAADAVVGTGTPASCTEAAFDTALATVGADGGTITFNCGGPAAITFSDQKIVPGDTKIDGAGEITLSGGKKTRLFFVNSGLSLTLQGLTLRDGSADVGGGLIEIFGGTVGINASKLLDSSAVTEGGAINCSIDQGGAITVSGSTLSGNTAQKGGAIYSGGCDLKLDDSTFSANKAVAASGLGGAIYLGAPGKLEATAVQWLQNEAYEGGALYVAAAATAENSKSTFARNKAILGAGLANHGTAENTDMLFEANEAVGGGGGIWSVSGELRVSGSTLRDNKGGGGGAAAITYGTASIFDSTIAGNHATSQNGGGINFGDGTLVVGRSTISGNTADAQDGQGGGIYQGSGSVQLDDSTVTANRAPLGGGYFHGGGPANLVYMTFSANQASDGSEIYDFAGGGTLKLYASAIDGGLDACSGKPFVSNGYNLSAGPCDWLTQTGDKVDLGSLKLGPLQDNGGVAKTLTKLPAIDSPLVDAVALNACPQEVAEDQRLEPRRIGSGCDAGAVERQVKDLTPAEAVVGSGSAASCTEAAFESALAAAQALGGQTVTFNCGGPATIVLTSAKEINTAVGVDGGNKITLSGGGKTPHFAIAPAAGTQSVSAGGDLTLENIILSDGFSYVDGGSIDNRGVLTLRHVTIRNSKTDPTYAGGAIASAGPLTIENSVLEDNQAGNGGALYLFYKEGSAQISDSILRRNKAVADVTTGWGGAAILWDGAELHAQRTRFENNEAVVGGAIYAATGDTVVALADKSAVSGNTAKIGSGGGIFNKGALSISTTSVSSNTGGGVTSYGDLRASGSTFSGNIAEDGISVDNRGQALFSNVTFSAGEAGLGGGLANSGAATLTYVTFGGNRAASAAALYQFGNTAKETLTLQNVIIDRSASGSNCIVDAKNATPITSLGHNLSSDGSCGLNKTGDGQNIDPLLAPLADNGGPTLTHMPQEDSPAIDGGECVSGLQTDQRGVARPQGTACDSGAVERQIAEGGSTALYLPVIQR